MARVSGQKTDGAAAGTLEVGPAIAAGCVAVGASVLVADTMALLRLFWEREDERRRATA